MAGYKNISSSNARSRQRSVDQIYLCGKVQSHTTLALAVVKGSTPEFMKDGRLDLSVVDVFSDVVEVVLQTSKDNAPLQ
jgi:hypothetical protein